MGNSTPFYGGAINGLKMESINISESIFQNVTSEKGTIYIYSASEPSYVCTNIYIYIYKYIYIYIDNKRNFQIEHSNRRRRTVPRIFIERDYIDG